MIVKAIYRKNLKMSEGKIAAQVSHAIIGLGITDPLCTIRVLGVSCSQFRRLKDQAPCYIHKDFGLTEVEEGTETAAAWIENEV